MGADSRDAAPSLRERRMAETNPLGWRRVLGPLGPRPRLTASILIGLAVGGALAWLAPPMAASPQLILGRDAPSPTLLGALFPPQPRPPPTPLPQPTAP